MIIGIGNDIVMIDRIEDAHADRILSAEEKEIYENFGSEKRKKEFLAGRFAAKEALTKALSSAGIIVSYQNTTIANNEYGRPFVKKPDWPGLNVSISISHEKDYAIAVCIAESGNNV
ncbi:MAG TPA: holo-ACP synthase [Candidatus Izemoplasmatales bacterium]|nr:holo-ACP synthase [Candidatus Izemoplasmatales bacterium]